MPAIPTAELRRRVTDRVKTIDGFTPTPTLFDPTRAPATIAHRGFSVAIELTANTGHYRDQAGEVARAASTVVVRFGWRLDPKDQLSSEDEACDAEGKILALLMAQDSTWPVDFAVRWDGARRTVLPGGEWTLHEITFIVDHDLAL